MPLTLIIGCMFAQKSTELLRKIRRSAAIGHNTLVINHSSDTRYTEEGKEVVSIITHDKETVKSSGNIITSPASSLAEISTKYNVNDFDLVVIDEGQFFSDLFKFVTEWVDSNMRLHVIVAGLDGDSERRPFGDILRLIPHAEEVLRLSALCSVCKDGTSAHFSKAIMHKESQVDIGGVDKYIPVCRKHFLE